MQGINRTAISFLAYPIITSSPLYTRLALALAPRLFPKPPIPNSSRAVMRRGQSHAVISNPLNMPHINA